MMKKKKYIQKYLIKPAFIPFESHWIHYFLKKKLYFIFRGSNEILCDWHIKLLLMFKVFFSSSLFSPVVACQKYFFLNFFLQFAHSSRSRWKTFEIWIANTKKFLNQPFFWDIRDCSINTFCYRDLVFFFTNHFFTCLIAAS